MVQDFLPRPSNHGKVQHILRGKTQQDDVIQTWEKVAQVKKQHISVGKLD